MITSSTVIWSKCCSRLLLLLAWYSVWWKVVLHPLLNATDSRNQWKVGMSKLTLAIVTPLKDVLFMLEPHTTLLSSLVSKKLLLTKSWKVLTTLSVPEVGLDGNQGLERYIVALMPIPLMTGRSIEMPYGSAVVANNFTFHDRTGRSLSQEENKVIADEMYTHNSLFPVINSVPRISLTVLYIIREKLGPQRKKSNWKDFPGNVYACIEIPVRLTTKWN